MGDTEGLTFAGNQLTGAIPTEIGNLNRLGRLDFGSNMLSGTIPSEIGLLSELTGFYVSDNQLTGTIPDEVLALTTTGKSLKILNFTSNSALEGFLSEINGLCFVNSTFFEVDCPVASIREVPIHCGCECTC